ncbi:hypothetical protein [Butyrivibrio sp. FCS014]|uniref:hypothetical protein n=1 Tax=Butyrivibrio sp. FCS014 TaxID=1408304 RepID=UPI000463ADA6|nr:hypothetical protein [Butyrivibrio sp. FCS014]
MSNDKLDKELLGEEELNSVHGGLDLSMGIFGEDKKGGKPKAGKKKSPDLILKEDSIVDLNPKKC